MNDKPDAKADFREQIRKARRAYDSLQYMGQAPTGAGSEATCSARRVWVATAATTGVLAASVLLAIVLCHPAGSPKSPQPAGATLTTHRGLDSAMTVSVMPTVRTIAGADVPKVAGHMPLISPRSGLLPTGLRSGMLDRVARTSTSRVQLALRGSYRLRPSPRRNADEVNR